MKRAMIHPFYPALKMDKFNPYVMVDHFFNPNQCHKIKGLMKGGYRAQIEGDGNAREDLSIRGTTIFGVEPAANTAWLFDQLHDFVVQANFDLWGFDLSGFCEGIQISRYNVGDHYDWHMDIGGGLLSQRKLSIVVQLTDPSEYEGGELEFFRNGDASRQIGTMILFPSYMQHRVRVITKGQRHSLVCWVSGNPFK